MEVCTVCLMQTQATPLFIASQNGHTSIVDYLIMKGAAIDKPNKVQCILQHVISMVDDLRVFHCYHCQLAIKYVAQH